MNKIAMLCIDREDYEKSVPERFKGLKILYKDGNWHLDDILIYPLYPKSNVRNDTINFVESLIVKEIIDKYTFFMNEKAKRTRYIERVFNGKHEKSFVEQEMEMW